MKKVVLLAVVVVCLMTVNVFAGPFSKFNEILNNATNAQAQKCLDNLATDLGNVMTGGSFGASASLGLAGIDLNLKVNYNKVSNEIMKADGTSELYVPMLTAAVGLPYRIDVLAKYGYMQDANIYGAGLRYTVYEGKDLVIPAVSVHGMYTMLNAKEGDNKLDANNLGFGAVATFNLPVVTPYIGLGWDMTKVNPKSSDKQNLEGSSDCFGYYAGVAISAVIVNGNLGIGIYDGEVTYTFGLSLGF